MEFGKVRTKKINGQKSRKIEKKGQGLNRCENLLGGSESSDKMTGPIKYYLMWATVGKATLKENGF